jgi:hypothetical protein
VPELIQLIQIDPFSGTVVILAGQGFQLLIQLIRDLRKIEKIAFWLNGCMPYSMAVSAILGKIQRCIILYTLIFA